LRPEAGKCVVSRMTPIVSLGFAFASLNGKRIRAAAKVVAIGALIGITVGALLTWISPIRNATPEIFGAYRTHIA
jgi:hypothetical protein